ncbi:AAA family ATPase [Ornithinimicrobium panacihumi]|uniref:AAA family ATPase n=1 Tax=Ornithinimicrobium panacihumi TaxID=2008449 RepID=UPI003F891F92
MSQPLVTAVAPRWEVDLASTLARSRESHLARRCADVPELLGVAAAGLARIAVVSSDLRALDRSVVDQLAAHDVEVLGVHPPQDEAAARTLRRWGVRVVLPTDSTADVLDAGIHQLLAREAGTGRPAGELADEIVDESSAGNADGSEVTSERGGPGPGSGEGFQGGSRSRAPQVDVAEPGADPSERSPGARSDQPPGEPFDGAETDVFSTGEEHGRGEVIAVWGPVGSPGRTTVAVNLAAELAADPTRPVLLVDADTYGASVAQVLGVLDEVPGVAAAARAADQGGLDRAALAELAPEIRPGLRVLTGLPRSERWPELRDVALADVLECCRQLAAWTVVDMASPLEQDEELSFDTVAPRRNGAALTALEAADKVVVVGTGDPVGLQRLVRGLDQVGPHSVAERTVVVTRVRPGPVGREPDRRIREALERYAGVRSAHLVPEDQDALDAALLQGSTLQEVRPRSAARLALVDLAAQVSGRPREGHARDRRVRARGVGRRG